jgi:hypothetical protein
VLVFLSAGVFKGDWSCSVLAGTAAATGINCLVHSTVFMTGLYWKLKLIKANEDQAQVQYGATEVFPAP